MYARADEAREVQGMKPVLEECWFLIGEVEHYSREQMKEVYTGVMGFQTERCIKLYSSHELSANQMHEIRLGVEDGLSYREVLGYANKHLAWQVMKNVREYLVMKRRSGWSSDKTVKALKRLAGSSAGAGGAERIVMEEKLYSEQEVDEIVRRAVDEKNARIHELERLNDELSAMKETLLGALGGAGEARDRR